PIVAAARARELDLPRVAKSEEVATNGVQASLDDGRQVRVGKASFIEEATGPLELTPLTAGKSAVYVSVDSEVAGVIVLSDPLRPAAATTVARLREAGVAEIAMVTGDARSTAESIAHDAGITTVHAEM